MKPPLRCSLLTPSEHTEHGRRSQTSIDFSRYSLSTTGLRGKKPALYFERRQRTYTFTEGGNAENLRDSTAKLLNSH